MDLSKPATKLSVHPQSAPGKNAKPAPLERFPHETQWCDSLWFQLFWADLTPNKNSLSFPASQVCFESCYLVCQLPPWCVVVVEDPIAVPGWGKKFQTIWVFQSYALSGPHVVKSLRRRPRGLCVAPFLLRCCRVGPCWVSLCIKTRLLSVTWCNSRGRVLRWSKLQKHSSDQLVHA